MKDKFKDALKAIMTTDEIDHCIKYTKGREKRWLKSFKAHYNPEVDYPFIVLMNAIKSPMLWSDIVLLMASYEEDVENAGNNE